MVKSCPYLAANGEHVYCKTCRKCHTHNQCKCAPCARCKTKTSPTKSCTACYERKRLVVCVACHSGPVGTHKTSTFPVRSCIYKGETPEPTFQYNRLQRSLGIEVELATWGSLNSGSLPRLAPLLAGEVVRDGSVRPSALELVSGRLQGDTAFKALYQLANSVKNCRATVNETCGVHVHVDAADFSMLDLRRTLLAWLAIQSQVFSKLVAPERLGNPYCPPNSLSTLQFETLTSASTNKAVSEFFYGNLYKLAKYPGESPEEYARRIKSVREHKYENAARRWALNFHSWMMRGTLEFRLKEGTVDPAELFWWPIWCGWLVETFSHLSEKEVQAWQNTPPDLVELTQSFHPSVSELGLVDWVKSKVA